MRPYWHNNNLYPVTIIRARYGGTYEGAEWLAFHENADAIADAEGDDITCRIFFSYYVRPIGRGDTPETALADLNDGYRNVINGGGVVA